MILAIEFFRRADVLVDRFEPAMDALVLDFVEILQFLGLVSGMIEGDWAITVAFSRGIGTDEIDLAASFELRGELIRIVLNCIVRRLIFNVCRG